ncbi:GntR family transcriptional regulator [Cohnella zeiphila]|uniref:GntR family transcriptional regulator n=1 Tax=Cohnella zeiphila TaxID=2761120 RepID=A0A7X0SJ12_9BACL|nr:GntR family transcriptional regulator [Cohnella zeiphila]MBB6730796.1 GntR family transcriptional regulator [Cohnella zeiphila]
MGDPSLRQLAYESIHRWIENGHFPGGTATSEIQLSRMLDMSRTPVRSALQQLELEGYVRIAPKQGIVILGPSSQRIGELLELAASFALFSASASKLAKREELAELVDSLAAQYRKLAADSSGKKSGGKPPLEYAAGDKSAAPDEAGAWIRFEAELLTGLVALSGNGEMSRLLTTTMSRLRWKNNARRWHAPHAVEAAARVEELIVSLAPSEPFEACRRSLQRYVQLLKRTWN